MRICLQSEHDYTQTHATGEQPCAPVRVPPQRPCHQASPSSENTHSRLWPTHIVLHGGRLGAAQQAEDGRQGGAAAELQHVPPLQRRAAAQERHQVARALPQLHTA